MTVSEEMKGAETPSEMACTVTEAAMLAALESMRNGEKITPDRQEAIAIGPGRAACRWWSMTTPDVPIAAIELEQTSCRQARRLEGTAKPLPFGNGSRFVMSFEPVAYTSFIGRRSAGAEAVRLLGKLEARSLKECFAHFKSLDEIVHAVFLHHRPEISIQTGAREKDGVIVDCDRGGQVADFKLCKKRLHVVPHGKSLVPRKNLFSLLRFISEALQDLSFEDYRHRCRIKQSGKQGSLPTSLVLVPSVREVDRPNQCRCRENCTYRRPMKPLGQIGRNYPPVRRRLKTRHIRCSPERRSFRWLSPSSISRATGEDRSEKGGAL